MIYLEHKPAAPLNRWVRTLWYAAVPEPEHSHERILPSGCVQVILNLERDYLHDCPEGMAERRMPPSLVVGARSVYEIINTRDMGGLLGVVFEPGGFAPFAGDAVDLFSNHNVGLGDIWGAAASSLLDRVREALEPREKMVALEDFLRQRLAGTMVARDSVRKQTIGYALKAIERSPQVGTVRELARSTGWSERRFSQVFREEVGFSPKVWTRIQRFQRALRQLHAGADLRWADLALDCGYYDQSHFANEFKAFSGIDATTYCAARSVWANQIPLN